MSYLKRVRPGQTAPILADYRAASGIAVGFDPATPQLISSFARAAL
jgi:hypothetical protein